MFLPEPLKITMGVMLIVFYALTYMARRRTKKLERERRIQEMMLPPSARTQPKEAPDIGWLGAFRLPEVPPERAARFRRSSGMLAGAKLIMLGVVMPIGYAVLTMMMFSEFEPAMTWLIGVFSFVCIALGIVGIVRNSKGD